MSYLWTLPPGWLLHCAVGGGLLLLVAWAVMTRSGQPARRHFLGALGVAAALVTALLCLGPRWLVLPVDLPFLAQAAEPEAPLMVMPTDAAELILEADILTELVATDGAPALVAEGPSAFAWTAWLAWLPTLLAAGWTLGATVLLGRWLLGYIALGRLLRAGRRAPPHVERLFAEMVGEIQPRPRLLVSSRVRVPLSCGLLRPTVVLPPDLCAAEESVLRWVFAHELAHLERRDAWTAFLIGLAQAVYFYLPWFWWLRRQVRLCQEYLADAAAVRQAGSPEDYAQFLLSLTRKPAVPLGATGVTGHSSDLYRRVAMLLQTPDKLENRCGWLWSLAATAGLLALAVFVSGIGLQAAAAEEDEKKPGEVEIEVVVVSDDGAQKTEKRKVFVIDGKEGKQGKFVIVTDDDEKKGQKGELPKAAFPDVEDIIKKLPQGVSEEQLKQFREQMMKARADMQKAMEHLHKQAPKSQYLHLHEADVHKKAVEEFKAAIEKGAKSAASKVELEKALEVYRKALETHKDGRVWTWTLLDGQQGQPGVQGRLAAWAGAGAGQGRLGIRVDKPSDTLAEQLDLPKGQGLVITDVVADSAAAKAGLKSNDILMELAGKKVPNDAEVLVSIVSELKAGTPVEALVLRKGKKETIKGIAVGETSKSRTIRFIEGVPSVPGVGGVKVEPRIRIEGLPGQPTQATPRIRSTTPAGGGSGKSVTMTVNRTNDNFTATHKEDDVTVSVSGTVEGGKGKANAIEIQEGGKTTKYDGVNKVPEQHREKVKKLLDSLDGGGGAKIEIRQPGARTLPALPATPATPLSPARPATPAQPTPPAKPAGRDVLYRIPNLTQPLGNLFQNDATTPVIAPALINLRSEPKP